MLSVKQGGIKYHFLSFWYDSTWDWTQVSRAIGEHTGRKGNRLGIVQAIEFWLYNQMLFAQTRIRLRKRDS